MLSRRRLRRTSASSAVSETPRPQALRDFQVHHRRCETIRDHHGLVAAEGNRAWPGMCVPLNSDRCSVCTVFSSLPAVDTELKRNRTRSKRDCGAGCDRHA